MYSFRFIRFYISKSIWDRRLGNSGLSTFTFDLMKRAIAKPFPFTRRKPTKVLHWEHSSIPFSNLSSIWQRCYWKRWILETIGNDNADKKKTETNNEIDQSYYQDERRHWRFHIYCYVDISGVHKFQTASFTREECVKNCIVIGYITVISWHVGWGLLGLSAQM